jgi:hypothetical protein
MRGGSEGAGPPDEILQPRLDLAGGNGDSSVSASFACCEEQSCLHRHPAPLRASSRHSIGKA